MGRPVFKSFHYPQFLSGKERSSARSFSRAAYASPSPLHGERAGVRGDLTCDVSCQILVASRTTPHSLSPCRGEGGPLRTRFFGVPTSAPLSALIHFGLRFNAFPPPTRFRQPLVAPVAACARNRSGKATGAAASAGPAPVRSGHGHRLEGGGLRALAVTIVAPGQVGAVDLKAASRARSCSAPHSWDRGPGRRRCLRSACG